MADDTPADKTRPDSPHPAPDAPALVLRGNLKDHALVNLAGAVLGPGLLYLIFRGTFRWNPGFFLTRSAVLVAWMLADFLWWKHRGVLELRIGGDGLEVFRGVNRVRSWVPASAVTDLYLHSRSGRKSLQILLGEKVVNVPGIITLYPGPKIMLTSDSFNDAKLEEAAERIRELLREQRKGPGA